MQDLAKRNKYPFENITDMDSLRETFSTLWEILTCRWYWFIVASVIAIITAPFFVIMIMISLPSPMNVLSMMLLICGSGIAAGYKDWVVSKSKERRKIKS